MGVKTRTKKSQGSKDEEERDSAAASTSPSDDSKGKRRSLRVRNSAGDESKDVSEKETDSERKLKANAADTAKDRNQDSETEPMGTEETEKTSKETGSYGDARESTEQHHHKHHHQHHHEHYLSEGTLKRLKAYLQSDMMDESLDEDAVAAKILKLDRAASDRVRFLHDPYADSDDDTDAPDQSYQAALEYVLALDFYKRSITDTQETNVNAPLDKKTLNWLRKALGLHKRNELWETTGHELKEDTEESENDEEGSRDKSNKSKRTVTRGMVRSTRIKRRAERETKESMNLNALVSAVEDLEVKFGPFAETPARKKRKHQKGSLENDSSVEERASKRRSRSKTPFATKKTITIKRPLIAHIRGETKVVSKSGRARRVSWPEKIVRVKVIVDGKEHTLYKQVVQVEESEKVKTSSEKNRAQPPLSLSMHKAADRQRRREAAAALSKAKGHLFGEVDPHQAMTLEALDYMEESNHISLGLLEWKRRQEWDSVTCRESTETTHEALPLKLAEAGMSTLPRWDSINPIPHIHRQPATVEPVRRRHTNEKYAEWINAMINILSGSGRSWALHEFFYSDIDRAWFNFDQFQVDIAKLRVPPMARLTRKEWSLVRRSIRKRPRRFSPRFIQSELAKLCQYRDIVRAIQHSKTAMPDFGFDVPAYIKVGTTVTAIHWKRRVLHRGIVIAHDPFRCGYLVQFERQELGFQFCPDYEVASHGGPEILVRAGTASLDGTNLGAFSDRHMVPGELSYGTHYGPVFMNQVDLKKDKQAKIGLLDTMVANEDISAKDTSTEKSFVDRVAEREALVDLIGTIDAALKRKTMLLDAIDKCNKDILFLREKHGQDAVKSLESSPFMGHYSWLQANLRTTNQSLNSALVMLRTMYGESYTSMHYQEDTAEKEAELENQLSRLREDDDVDSKLVLPWSLSIGQACTKIGNLVVRTANDLSDKWDSMSEEEKLRAEYIEHSLSGACRLLLNMNYCGALVRSERADVGSEKGLTLNVEPMNACIERELLGLFQTPMPFSSTTKEDVSKLHGADDMRFSAMNELKEALLSYETELTAMHVAKNIIRS